MLQENPSKLRLIAESFGVYFNCERANLTSFSP
jgi:hypothetical protein